VRVRGEKCELNCARVRRLKEERKVSRRIIQLAWGREYPFSEGA